jgi:hypothetical protein
MAAMFCLEASRSTARKLRHILGGNGLRRMIHCILQPHALYGMCRGIFAHANRIAVILRYNTDARRLILCQMNA